RSPRWTTRRARHSRPSSSSSSNTTTGWAATRSPCRPPTSRRSPSGGSRKPKRKGDTYMRLRTTRALALAALGFALFGTLSAHAAPPASVTAKVQNGTLTVTGTAGADVIGLSSPGTTATSLDIDVGEDGTVDFSFDRSTFTSIVVNGGAGDDVLDASRLFLAGPITLNGGAGDDTLRGGDGNDLLNGGPGDGSDTVEGQGGHDVLDFNGSNAAEKMAFAANGTRVLFTRDVGAITMDLNGIETTNVRALGSADTVTVGDLAGTGMKTVNVDLAPDGAADTVIAQGTPGVDKVSFVDDDGGLAVDGLAAETRVTGGDPGLDALQVSTLGGDDSISSSADVTSAAAAIADGGEGTDSAELDGTPGNDSIGIARNGAFAAVFTPSFTFDVASTTESTDIEGGSGDDTITGQNGIAGITALTIDGGPGNDTLLGGDGNDLLNGGPGDDHVDGNRGNDTALLGPGDDHFQWDPGDGSDTVEGQGGHDQLDFNGSNAAEKIALQANGSRVLLTRDVAAVTMDLNGIEIANVRTLGSADTVTVGDLTGTGMKTVNVDLAGFDGTPDASADTVIAQGTAGNDKVKFVDDDGGLAVDGLAAETRVTGGDLGLDSLQVSTLGGDDSISSSTDVTGTVAAVVDGGEGTDAAEFDGTDGNDSIGIARNGSLAAAFAPGST